MLREVHDRPLTISEVARAARMSPFVVPGRLPIELFPGCLSLMGPAFAIFEKHRSARIGQTAAS